ncbi:PREDICTED: phospholipase A2 inhibitor and Ly6/PLAUR domain-containing protein-like, partial [Gekko japonicus]|uniref:Phospholipase A2 inhibitor and Ly6/PLAUR domain-containing protein-like n=1 Tax=Gekko japonicus TaxID=146911 RepID=A0ABM1KLD5_GEKJA
ASLKCISCQDPLKQCDNSESVDCKADEEFCLSFTAHIPIMGRINKSFKSCASSNVCQPGNYSLTTKDSKHFQSIVTCCNTDHCNNDTLQVPPSTNKARNGNRCPVCFSMGSDSCQTEELIDCIGEETQCISFSASVKLSASLLPLSLRGALQGCATPNLCASPALPPELSKNGIEVNITLLQCSSGTSAATTLTDSTTLPLPG